MAKVQMRVIHGSIRRKGAGEIVSLSRRDARLLARLGRVVPVAGETVPPEPKRQKAPKKGTPVKRAAKKATKPAAKKATAKKATTKAKA